LIKKTLIDRVVANTCDFDMEYLFPNSTPLEDMAEAYKGVVENLPRKTLRKRYQQQPLMIKPQYSGDFLEKLKEEQRDLTAADQTNLKDFSCPEEMLKHQEEPYPRDMTDYWIERNKPVDNKTLKEWDDRAWSPQEAPEWSEDLIERLRGVPKQVVDRLFKLPGRAPARVASSFLDRFRRPDPSTVVASFLLNGSPLFSLPAEKQQRIAMTIELLKSSKIKGRPIDHRGDRRDPRTVGVAPSMAESKPDKGLWAFRTSSGKGNYITFFQFIPEKGKERVRDLKVRVSCSCPSWLWWGGIYNAFTGSQGGEPFLYGPVHFPPVNPTTRPMLVAPNVRDPGREFIACKHMLSCIPYLENNRLPYPEVSVPPAERVEVEIPPEMEVEELRIPVYLNRRAIENQEPIKGVLKRWEGMGLPERDEFIKDLDSPAHLLYMGYRFPGTAATSVLDQLERKKFSPGWKPRIDKAKRDFGRVIQQVRRFRSQHGARMAAEEKTWDEAELRKDWLGMSESKRKDYVEALDDPVDVYSIFLMFPKHSLPLVLGRLREMLKDSKHEKEAEEYLRQLL
jgi:hypothetical protein